MINWLIQRNDLSKTDKNDYSMFKHYLNRYHFDEDNRNYFEMKQTEEKSPSYFTAYFIQCAQKLK